MKRQRLKCETDTPETGEEVLQAFQDLIGGHDHVEEVFEHGQWWINCAACGAQWAAYDTEGPDTLDGLEFEQISNGDETCAIDAPF